MVTRLVPNYPCCMLQNVFSKKQFSCLRIISLLRDLLQSCETPLPLLCIGKHSITWSFCNNKWCVQSERWDSLNPKNEVYVLNVACQVVLHIPSLHVTRMYTIYDIQRCVHTLTLCLVLLYFFCPGLCPTLHGHMHPLLGGCMIYEAIFIDSRTI